MDSLCLEIRQKVLAEIGLRLDISALEDQVFKTSFELSTIRDSLETKLNTVAQSVAQLTDRVDSQYHSLNDKVANIIEIIEHQNAVIAKIQQELKFSVETLTQKLTNPFFPKGNSLTASTSLIRQYSPR
jgi:TolA-binding protein